MSLPTASDSPVAPVEARTPNRALPAALRRLLWAGGAALTVVAAVYGGHAAWDHLARTESTDNAYVKGDLTYVATKVSGYVLAVDTENNRRVAPGQVLIRLDPRDYQAAVDEARAALARAQADLAQLQAQQTLQHSRIEVAAAGVVAAQANSERAALDRQRAERLVGLGGVSRTDLDVSRSTDVGNQSQLIQARGQATQARQQLAVLAAQREAAQASIDAARARLAKAQSDLEATVIHAPREGLVAARNVRPGEYLGVGHRVLAVVPTQGLWVEAYLKETQIGQLSPGSPVRIAVDALPGLTLCGRLESLGNSSASELALLPPDNATGNFTKVVRRFPVRVQLPPQAGLERLGIGMSVVPTFSLGAPTGASAAADCQGSRA